MLQKWRKRKADIKELRKHAIMEVSIVKGEKVLIT